MRLPLTDIIVDYVEQPKARLILAHGAGAGMNSGFMQLLAEQLADHNVEVWRFNFNYMQRFADNGKRSVPPKMPILCQQFSAVLNNCSLELPLFIGGKSMGGRVASMLSQTDNVRAIFAFGYPFHPVKKNTWRTEHFAGLKCPLFIAQGERDAFGCKTELADKYWPHVKLQWLSDGDHDFYPRIKTGLTQQQLVAQAAQFCSRNIDEVLLATE
jgi:uncharacterized protein